MTNKQQRISLHRDIKRYILLFKQRLATHKGKAKPAPIYLEDLTRMQK